MKNDLHIRTNFSASASADADYVSVLKKCEEAKLDRISITDFDTCLFHVINALTDTSSIFKGEILPGMECDVCEDGIVYELLAYNFEPFKTLEWSYRTYGTLEDRQTKIKDLLVKKAKSNGIKLALSKEFNGKVDFGHKYIYENMLNDKDNVKLLKKYKISTLTDFYNASTKQKDFPLYIDMNKVYPNTKIVVDFIHSVGGIVVLAQPMKAKNKDNLKFLLDMVEKYKIDGIEVYHPTHSKSAIKSLLLYAKANSLMVTGGSNYNGKKDNCTLGITNIDKEEKEILKYIK